MWSRGGSRLPRPHGRTGNRGKCDHCLPTGRFLVPVFLGSRRTLRRHLKQSGRCFAVCLCVNAGLPPGCVGSCTPVASFGPAWSPGLLSRTMPATPTSSPLVDSDRDHSAPLTWPGHVADDVAATFGPEPKAHLTATRDGLSISSTRGEFHLPRASVVKICRGNFYPWFFAAVRVHHHEPSVPVSLQFKALGHKSSEVLARLRELGYPVA